MSLASITELEMHITAQGCRLRNDLYCVEWDVKLYYTIPFHNIYVTVTSTVLRWHPRLHFTNGILLRKRFSARKNR